jgi:hypothetical protein
MPNDPMDAEAASAVAILLLFLNVLKRSKEKCEKRLATKPGYLFYGDRLRKRIDHLEAAIERAQLQLEKMRNRPKRQWPHIYPKAGKLSMN